MVTEVFVSRNNFPRLRPNAQFFMYTKTSKLSPSSVGGDLELMSSFKPAIHVHYTYLPKYLLPGG